MSTPESRREAPSSPEARSFEFVEGPLSDAMFRAYGPSLADVFHAAGDALLAATVEDLDSVRPRIRRRLQLSDHDRELLLLRFLNELIYLRDAENLLLRPLQVRCTQGEALELDAELAGEPLDPARHALLCDVKAATAHALHVRSDPEAGWRAQVTLDV